MTYFEELKPFSDLLLPDERWSNFVEIDSKTYATNPYTWDLHYQAVKNVHLVENVPCEIRNQFNTAMMLCIYAWLYYPFHQTAELKAFATLEMALRVKFPMIRGGIKRLLTHAINEGYLSDNEFSCVQTVSDDPLEYTKKLPEIVSSLRNDLAHGSFTLHPHSIQTLRNCAETINQIFVKH